MALGDVYQYQDERVSRRGLDLGNDTLLRLGDRRSFQQPIVVRKPAEARIIALSGSPAAEAFTRNVRDGAPRSAAAAIAANTPDSSRTTGAEFGATVSNPTAPEATGMLAELRAEQSRNAGPASGSGTGNS